MWKMVLEMEFLASEEDWLSSCDVALYKNADASVITVDDKEPKIESLEEPIIQKPKKTCTALTSTVPQATLPPSPPSPATPASPTSSNPRKRPRRSAAAVSSYVVPGSDDEAIKEEDEDTYYTSEEEDDDEDESEDEDFQVRAWKRPRTSDASVRSVSSRKGKGKAESDLQMWIKHFGLLLKNEERKVGTLNIDQTY